MFRRAILDKMPECIFVNFEIALTKLEQFQNFKKSRGKFNLKIARTKHAVIG